MQPSALRALEFDRIVEAVTGFALTPLGAERLARLQPSTDPQTVAQWQAATSETVRFVAAHGVFPLRASSDLPQILAALAVDGRALEALRLLALATFLDSIEESRGGIRRAAGSFPLLEAATGGAASFKGESANTREKIDPSGDIVDAASPELRLIRDRLRKQRARLRSTLESYLRGKDTAKYLQDQVVTERNGRYVLVVKAEHRGGIPGIVHGTSTSGAGLFLEPLSTVEINNDIVALGEQEREEVHRILLALTDAFRQREGDLQRTFEAAAELDVLQARARFSESLDGIEPGLSTDGAFELQAARHPLLKHPIPVTIKVIPPATALLVTGPNRAEHLAKIDHDLRALEHEHRLAARERETLQAAEVRMHQREETFKRRLNEELETQVRKARKEIDDVIAALKAKADAIARAPRLVSTGDTGVARSEARAAVDAIAARVLSGDGSTVESTRESAIESATRNPQSAIRPVAIGDRVIVGGTIGSIQEALAGWQGNIRPVIRAPRGETRPPPRDTGRGPTPTGNEADTADSTPTPPQRGCRAGGPGLPHRHVGEHVVEQVSGSLGHSATAAARTERAAFARKRYQPVEAAIITAKSSEPAGERATP
jgi:dsDNA-specific endonuclease/ATPase MutS2